MGGERRRRLKERFGRQRREVGGPISGTRKASGSGDFTSRPGEQPHNKEDQSKSQEGKKVVGMAVMAPRQRPQKREGGQKLGKGENIGGRIL